jgi:hypothetical protein
MELAIHGGSRQGAGRKRKWTSEAERKWAERLEKRTAAELLVGEAVNRLVDLLDENPAAFDFWVWLRYFARHPEERPVGVKTRRVKLLLRKHPLSRLDEGALVKAALMLDQMPWQSESGPVDWEPFFDLLPWAPAKKGFGEWIAPRRSAEYVDEIGPRIIDERRGIFSFDDTLSKP